MKLTSAQLWLAHTLETLFFGAVVTGGISVYQALGTGNYDARSLAAIFIPAVIAVLSKGSSAVISNNNLVQAGEDTLKQLTASHQNLVAQVQQLLAQPIPAQVLQTSQPVSSPVAQPAVSSGVVAQSPQAQFKPPVSVVEHPPIDAGMMVNTLPTLPAFTAQQPQ